MKAISPMVATVLLIAFTIGVGGLVSIFVTGLTTTQTGIASNQSESTARCAGAWLNLYRVTNTTVFYQNPTNQNITRLVIMTSDGSQIPLSLTDQLLIPGESNSTNIGNSSGTAWGLKPGLGSAAGNTSVTIRGLCQSIVTVEGVCKQGQGCWQAGY